MIMNILMGAFVLVTVWLYASSRVLNYVKTVALQALIMAGMTLVSEWNDPNARTVVVVLASTLVKAVVLPFFLVRAVRDTGISREIEPTIGFIPSILAGAGFLALAFWLAGTLPVSADHNPVLLSVAFFSVLSGLFLCIGRGQVVSQAIGYLVLENGVFMTGTAFGDEAPTVVEAGVLLDVTVAIFVMVTIIHHLRRAFTSLDSGNLTNLKD